MTGNPCPVCFGKGKWLGYSDSEWHATGGTKPPTTPMSCGYCRGSGIAPKVPPAGEK